jgi:hypothetical protein
MNPGQTDTILSNKFINYCIIDKYFNNPFILGLFDFTHFHLPGSHENELMCLHQPVNRKRATSSINIYRHRLPQEKYWKINTTFTPQNKTI